jgi:hypothetical protein
MTQDEIIEMARQARLMSEYDEASPWVEDHEITQYVEAFAKLVAAKEREACAKVCEDIQDCGPENGCCPTYWNEALEKAEEVIRARGEA